MRFSVFLWFGLAGTLGACQTAATRDPGNPVGHGREIVASSAAWSPDAGFDRALSYREAVELRDELTDGMVAIMLRDADDCARMARELERYIDHHDDAYRAITTALANIPWKDRELPPEDLRSRILKTDETLRRMARPHAACGTNRDVVMAMVHLHRVYNPRPSIPPV